MRRSYLIGGGAAAVVLLVAVVILVWPGRGSAPETVVRDYLNAIRAGELAEALRIAGGPGTDGSAEDAFLTAEAVSGDWEIERVIRRYPGVDTQPAVVDVTLRASDGTIGQGRFRVADEDGGWSIEEPFGSLSHWPGSADFLELNGVVHPTLEGEATTYRLFPGAYRMYQSLADLVVVEPPTLIALPGVTRAPGFQPPFTLSEAGTQAAQEAIDAYVDACATRTEASPTGCPFAADTDTYTRIGRDRYEDTEDLAWEVVSYPEVLVVTDEYGWSAVDRHPGAVRITGTGVPLDGEERTTFAAECQVDVSILRLTLTQAGEFEIAAADSWLHTC